MNEKKMKIQSATRQARLAKVLAARQAQNHIGWQLHNAGMKMLRDIRREIAAELRGMWQAEDFAESRVARGGANVTTANLLGSKEIGMNSAN